jgi:ribosome-associated toxin RatA of RatAB toxin-antitoxin module
MNTIKHSRTIAAPVDFLFDYSQRNSCRMDWDPFVSDVQLHDDHDLPSEGVEVTVHTWNKMAMTCRYVQFRRPDCIAIKMLRGPASLATFGGTWRFESLDERSTNTTFNYSFSLKKGLRWLTPFAKLYFSWDMSRRLGALKKGAERAYSKYETHGVLPWLKDDAA